MLIIALAFLLGDMLLQSNAVLPQLSFLFTIFLISIFISWAMKKITRFYDVPLLIALGFAYSAIYVNSLMSESLPKAWEGKLLIVRGEVASIPIVSSGQMRFIFAIKAIQNNEGWEKHHFFTQLSRRLSSKNYPIQHFNVGEKWQLAVKLKRIHAIQNPGGFDYEAWSLQKKLRANGYMIEKGDHQWLGKSYHYRYWIDQLREALKEKITAILPHSTTSPWLLALIIGEREGISQPDWQVLRRTGTNHLMAIAGLHIGLVAAMMRFLINRLWRLSTRLLYLMPAQQASAIGALILALIYSALAGFSIPTARACLMLSFFIIIFLQRKTISGWQIWSCALMIVLLLNPLVVLSESFWLSFGTLALIMYGMQNRVAPKGMWWKWGRVQWVIGFGLIPFTLYFFQECSLISFIANSVAIPWLAFFILPLCLLGTLVCLFSSAIAAKVFWFADQSLSGLWWCLLQFAHLPFSAWQKTIATPFLLVITLIAFLLLLLPKKFPGKWMGLIWLAPLFFDHPPIPARGDFFVTVLDVGQGLSVSVQTKHHFLIYDTGPKFYPTLDMGEQVVLPYLHTLGINQIDMMVISHGDNDHIGGAQSILKALPVRTIRTSVPEKFLSHSNVNKCLSGDHWEWDGVSFTFLYPNEANLHLGNNSSCVLRIGNGKQSVLLTGDIEKYAEHQLLKLNPSLLKATVLVAPHHGSKTSDLDDFIEAIHPEWVLYPTGYLNRYHFPHPRVLEKYAAISSKQLNTSETGAMMIRVDRQKDSISIEAYRVIHPHYWYL